MSIDHFVLNTFHILNKIYHFQTSLSSALLFYIYIYIELSVKRDLSWFLLAHEGNHVQQCILIFLVLQTPAIVLLILQTPSPNLSEIVDALW